MGEEKRVCGCYRAGALAGEDWQKRKRISFTFRDRLARHAIAAGSFLGFSSLLFSDPFSALSCIFLCWGTNELPRCGCLVRFTFTPSDPENCVWASD